MPSADAVGRGMKSRPFGIGDALILVASAAATLAIYREMTLGPFGIAFADHLDDLAELIRPLNRRLVEALIPGTIACFLIRCRRPRPTLRRLARQPGFVACLSALVPLVAIGSWTYALTWRVGWHDSAFATLEWMTMNTCGYAVAASWACLAVGRRWRVERGWVDRLGRGVGVGWLSVVILHFVVDFVG